MRIKKSATIIILILLMVLFAVGVFVTLKIYEGKTPDDSDVATRCRWCEGDATSPGSCPRQPDPYPEGCANGYCCEWEPEGDDDGGQNYCDGLTGTHCNTTDWHDYECTGTNQWTDRGYCGSKCKTNAAANNPCKSSGTVCNPGTSANNYLDAEIQCGGSGCATGKGKVCKRDGSGFQDACVNAHACGYVGGGECTDNANAQDQCTALGYDSRRTWYCNGGHCSAGGSGRFFVGCSTQTGIVPNFTPNPAGCNNCYDEGTAVKCYNELWSCGAKSECRATPGGKQCNESGCSTAGCAQGYCSNNICVCGDDTGDDTGDDDDTPPPQNPTLYYCSAPKTCIATTSYVSLQACSTAKGKPCYNTQAECMATVDQYCPMPTNSRVMTGRIYCQEAGSNIIYPIVGAHVAAHFDSQASEENVLTDIDGEFSFTDLSTITSDRNFNVQVIAVPSATKLSTGRLYSDMVFAGSSCSAESPSTCTTSALIGGTRIAQNSAARFLFRYTNCSSLTLSGQVYCQDTTAGSTVYPLNGVQLELLKGGTVLSTVTTDSTGNWRYAENSTSSGTYGLRVKTVPNSTLSNGQPYSAMDLSGSFCANTNLSKCTIPTGLSGCGTNGVDYQNCSLSTTTSMAARLNIRYVDCAPPAPINQCVALTANPTTIRTGEDNVVAFTLTYRHSSTTNPFPNMKLRVGDPAVGRDVNNPTQSLVTPTYTFNAAESLYTYRFTWEAVNVGGGNVPAASYPVVVLSDGTSTVISDSACQATLTVSADEPQHPVFVINKTSSSICEESSGDAVISYTITVTNIGPVDGTTQYVKDTFDANLLAIGVTPTDLVPAGTIAGNVITWPGSLFTPGQSKTYTYKVRIPAQYLVDFMVAGVHNQAEVKDTEDNIATYDLVTPITCAIPSTGLFDDQFRLLLLGLMVIILGILVYRYRLGSKTTENILLTIFDKLGYIPRGSFERGIEDKYNGKRRNKGRGK